MTREVGTDSGPSWAAGVAMRSSDADSGAETASPEVRTLLDVALRLQATHKQREHATGGRVGDDHRDAANMMLTLRAVEFALAAADDFFYNRPVAGAVMGRALLETALALRWCLKADENARRWWLEGDATIQKTLRSLGQSRDPAVVAVRNAPSIGVGLPGFQVMAREGGLSRPYERWYAPLSGYAHGSRMSTGHAYGPPREQQLPPLVVPCIYFADDVGTVFTRWIASRQLAPANPHP